MSAGHRFRKRPVEVGAVRYGTDEDGRWYPGAVDRVARFILELDTDAELTQARILDVARPAAGIPWDPPEHATLEVYDHLHDSWVKVFPGQWVIRGIRGETYPCDHEVLRDTYEPVGGEPR
jgi:hypothetical protein